MIIHCVYIPLPNDKYVIVDMEDYDLALNVWSDVNGYAARNQGKLFLHTVIMERMIEKKISKNLVVAHKNTNRLDNRRSNLELRRKGSTGSKHIHSSNFIGIWKKKNRYFAHIRKNGEKYYLGSFLTQKEAAIAYNEKARELFGIYAVLNEIENNTMENEK